MTTVLPLPAQEIMAPGDAVNDRARWLATRRTGIGSSDVSAILGRQAGDYARCARDVWEVKTGRVPLDDDGPSEAAIWGTLLEPVVRTEWSRRSGIGVTEVGMHRSRTHPFMLYDADGLCDDGGVYEGKTAHQFKAKDWEDGVPEHAFWQVQHGMAVLDRPHAWVVGLIGGQRPVVHRVARDDDLIASMIAAERKFWAYVEFDSPPPLDGSAACERWILRHYPLAVPEKAIEVDPDTAALIQRTYSAVKAGERTAKEHESHAKALVRELMGDAEIARCGGRTVATWRNTGEFDEESFRAAHPEIAARFEVPAVVLDRAALAKAHPEEYRAHRGRRLLITKEKDQ